MLPVALAAALVVLPPASELDMRLVQRWKHSSVTGPHLLADKLRDEFYDAFNGLADMPGKGHTRDEIADSRHRVWSVHSYLIIYRPETRPLQIVSVVHGARDLRALFGPDA